MRVSLVDCKTKFFQVNGATYIKAFPHVCINVGPALIKNYSIECINVDTSETVTLCLATKVDEVVFADFRTE